MSPPKWLWHALKLEIWNPFKRIWHPLKWIWSPLELEPAKVGDLEPPNTFKFGTPQMDVEPPKTLKFRTPSNGCETSQIWTFGKLMWTPLKLEIRAADLWFCHGRPLRRAPKTGSDPLQCEASERNACVGSHSTGTTFPLLFGSVGQIARSPFRAHFGPFPARFFRGIDTAPAV